MQVEQQVSIIAKYLIWRYGLMKFIEKNQVKISVGF